MGSFQELLFNRLANAVIKQAKEKGEMPVAEKYVLQAILTIEKNARKNPDNPPMLERIHCAALKLENEASTKH